MIERAGDPVFFEEPDQEPEAEPGAGQAGSTGPPTSVGSGVWDDDNWRDLAIEDLHLSMRTYNCLRRGGLITVGLILEKGEGEILELRNFGRNSYDELRERLAELGILAVDARWDSRSV